MLSTPPRLRYAPHISGPSESSQLNHVGDVMQMQSNNRQFRNQLIRHVAIVQASKLQSRIPTMPDLHYASHTMPQVLHTVYIRAAGDPEL